MHEERIVGNWTVAGKRVKDFKRSAQDETRIQDFQTEI